MCEIKTRHLLFLLIVFKQHFQKGKKKIRLNSHYSFLLEKVPRSSERLRKIFCTPLLMCLSSGGLRMTKMKKQITVKRATSKITNGDLSERERHHWPHNPGNLIYLLSVICMLNFHVFLQQNFLLLCQP